MPPLGIRPGRFLPGALHRDVLSGQLGFTEESVWEWFKGKGQGKGGKQGSGGMPAQLGSKQGQTSGFRWTRRMTSSGVEVCLFCVYLVRFGPFGPVVLYVMVLLNIRHGVDKVFGCYKMCFAVSCSSRYRPTCGRSKLPVCLPRFGRICRDLERSSWSALTVVQCRINWHSFSTIPACRL